MLLGIYFSLRYNRQFNISDFGVSGVDGTITVDQRSFTTTLFRDLPVMNWFTVTNVHD